MTAGSTPASSAPATPNLPGSSRAIALSEALARLAKGLRLKDGMTRPCGSGFWTGTFPAPRIPPIRHRLIVPTAWLELVLTEGKNRQIRRMTAAIGHPTLRLLRIRSGSVELGEEPGRWRWENEKSVNKAKRH